MSRPTDVFESIHYDMTRVHQCFTAGFDSILGHLAAPPLDDVPNFCGYMHTWASAILHHHDSEELTLFPVLNTRLDFAKEQDQHKVLHDFLDRFIALVQAYASGERQFDAGALRELMEASKDDFLGHLKEELVDIHPQKLRAAGFSAAELTQASVAMTAYAHDTADPFVVVPFIVSHTPPEHKHWPEMPWMIKRVVIPYVFALRHYGYWKYAPYAMS